LKKLALLLLIILMFSTAAFADHAQDSLGIGAVFGLSWEGARRVPYADLYPYSYLYSIFNPYLVGLNLKIPRVPVYWGVNIKPFHYSFFGLGITGDFYFWEPNLITKTTNNNKGSYELKIDWYVGAGLYTNMYFGNDFLRGNGGLRVPFGVSWHTMQQIKKFEVSLGSVFGFGIGGHKYRAKPYLHWFVTPVEFAVRWWFGS